MAKAAILEPVIYEAEDVNYEGAKIHKKKTSIVSGAIWANTEGKEVFSVAQVLKETCTRS